MAEIWKRMNLHLFEGGAAGAAGAGASAAPAAGEAGEGPAAEVTPGVLQDGTEVDNRLAARMEEQARKRKARGEEPVRAAQMAAPQAEEPEAGSGEPSLDDQWAEAKKGKFRELFGRDVQAAVQDRFKNQKDANDQLVKLQPMLDALAKQHGIESGNYEELSKVILDDDSLYEQEAEEAGMTVEGYKMFQQLQSENQRLKEREQQEQADMELRRHFQSLAQQAEELRKIHPDFDLNEELKNQTFFRLTLPNSGLKLADAYYAVHHKELEPQVMAYGFQKAQQQISETIQANRRRPTEGAMKSQGPASVAVDPRSLTREQRKQLIERARRGEEVVF